MLEFALMTPLVILFIFLVIDAGRLALTYTSLQDATAASARAVARTGKVGDLGSGSCGSTPGSVPSSQVALYAFCNAAATVPFVDDPRLLPERALPASNGYCQRFGRNTVEMYASARPSLIGPWRYATDPLGYEVSAAAVARCEVGR